MNKKQLVRNGLSLTLSSVKIGAAFTDYMYSPPMPRRLLILPILAIAILLVACGGQVDEAASGTVVGKIEEGALGPGKTAQTTLDLPPGKYVLICNVPGHYKEGMYLGLQIDDSGVAESVTVDVELGEWFIRSGNTDAPGGAVTLAVTNKGDSSHNLVIIRTDLAPDSLIVG